MARKSLMLCLSVSLLCVLSACAKVEAASGPLSGDASVGQDLDSTQQTEPDGLVSAGECTERPRVTITDLYVEEPTEILDETTLRRDETASGDAAQVVFERRYPLFLEGVEEMGVGGTSVKLYGRPVDTGAREQAAGAVEIDSSSDVPSGYVLEVGDTREAIARRFCLPLPYMDELNYFQSADHPGDKVLLLPPRAIIVEGAQ